MTSAAFKDVFTERMYVTQYVIDVADDDETTLYKAL